MTDNAGARHADVYPVTILGPRNPPNIDILYMDEIGLDSWTSR